MHESIAQVAAQSPATGRRGQPRPVLVRLTLTGDSCWKRSRIQRLVGGRAACYPAGVVSQTLVGSNCPSVGTYTALCT
jgi:hypothetical protein